MSDHSVAAQNQANWDDYSQAYLRFKHHPKFIQAICDDPSWAFQPEAWMQIRRYFPDLSGKRVCVPSSGDQYAVIAFALLGARVTSCDISRQQLDAGQRLAQSLGLDIEFVPADTMHPDVLENDAFELVYTSNGVHVWLDDLPAMYRSMHRILRPGGMYIMCDVHPFQRPFGDNLSIVKPYSQVGPFVEETCTTFAWRVQDMLNAMADAGLCFVHMEEMHDRKNYEYPFWLPLEDAVNGVKVNPAEVDRLYDWRQNPAMALPAWLCVVCRK